MTQLSETKRLLRRAGPRGVTTGEFIDARIPRFSARIDELRDAGWVIHRARLRASSYRYTVISEPVSVVSPAVSKALAAEGARGGGDESGRLFEPEKPLPHGAYGDVAA